MLQLRSTPVSGRRSANASAGRSAIAPLGVRLAHGGARPASLWRQQRPECGIQQDVSRESTVACSTAAAGLCPSPPQQDVADTLRVLAKCRTIFCYVAAFAVWGFIASAAPSWPPFASMSLAAGDTTARGAQSAIQSAWAGLAAGFLHTLCGPDHLAALTPLTIGRNRIAASALGALWGFGHSTGQLILGLVFVLLKERFHDLVPFLSRWAGTVVGLTLLAIGALGIYESWVEGAEHAAGAGAAEASSSGADEAAVTLRLALEGAGASMSSSTSGGASPPPSSVRAWLGGATQKGIATYATGIVYGLQPDALFVVIPALALPTKTAAVAYCTMFVLGTVTAMGGYTLLIAGTSEALTRDKPWLQAHLSTIASSIAIGVGLLVLAASFGLPVPSLPWFS